MKKLLIVLVVILAIAGAAYYYLREDKLQAFEPQIKERLNKLVMDASNGLYHLEIEKLETDVVSSKIIIINAHLRPDTLVYAQLEKAKEAPNDIFDITISQLSIDDIVPGDFLANKAINLRRLFINKPVIAVKHKKQPYNMADVKETKSIFQKIQNDISKIQVDTIILNDIDFLYTNTNKKNKLTRLSNIKIFFSDILLDSTTQNDRERFFFAKNCLISLKDYTNNTADSLYRFKIGAVEIQTRNQALQLTSLQFQPRVAAQTFYKKVRHQQDMFDLTINQIKFNRIDWWAIIAEESFLVNKVSMQNGAIKIFNDKSQPVDTRSKVNKYPHQLLMKLPFTLNIDTIAVNNIDLSYTELNPKSGEKGTLSFNNIRAVITNITNDPEQIKADKFTRINARALFMKSSPVKADFAFDLANYKKGNFTVTASIGALKANELNAITVPLGMLRINSLDLKSLDATMKGDNNIGTGTVKMIYDDLNISALKSSADTLKKRGLLSFIANTFVIKTKNPLNNQPVRIETASFPRNPQRSFFNLVWKTIFTGAGKTVGYKVKK